MSVLVIWASPNRDGLTAAAKDKVLEGLQSAGKEAEVMHLNKLDIKRCLTCGHGWGICESQGQCVIQDDFQEIYEKIIASEGIVWITPVYWHDLAECLKSFLDRIRRCETHHNHYLQGKKNVIVACAGGTGLGAIQCLERLEETLSHMEMITVDRIPVIQFNKVYMLPALQGAGERFAQELDIRS